jgi:DNA-binding PadR family transcriptional regulator
VATNRGAAEPVRFALLGLLLDRPSYGYELAQRFDPSTALGDIVRLAPSHLYALLARLERDGLIEGQQQDAGARPQRRVYSLTERGRETALTWLVQPVDHPRHMRIEFPLKLYVARTVWPEAVEPLIERQRAALTDYIDRLKGMPAPDAADLDRSYILLMRVGRIGRAQAALEWLDASESVVRG